ncbi:MAG: SDR family oxidoreductase [Anaerolineales bacterium]|nr:SDR family oxidoreductase [Anaerolineales bacterium]
MSVTNPTTSASVVLVTGGASGMGAATAALFVADGAHVFIIDRNETLAQEVATRLGCQLIVGDVSDPAFCQQAVDTAVNQHGQLDVLVNAAGVIVRADALNTTDDQWQHVLNVNLSGTFYMCRAALNTMKRQQSGAIINFGSIWGMVGGTGHIAYCASKGAIHNLTRSLALDHARDGIRINAVAPGEVNTPMLSHGREKPYTPADLQELADRVVPTGRLAEPEEIAQVVHFLASDKASYMTGAIVPVDAGYTAR